MKPFLFPFIILGCCHLTQNLLSSYKSVLGPRDNGSRPLILTIILVLSIFYFASNGLGPLWYLLYRLQYNIDLKQYADMAVLWAFRSVAANLLLLPFLSKCFRHTAIILLAILILMALLILMAITTSAIAMLTEAFGTDYIFYFLWN